MQISVIIPAYNAAATIEQTLQSVEQQSLAAWEAIVVDDGSTDDTAVVVRRFVQRDPRFRLISQANLGGSAARNTGLALAGHDWLLFLDADDRILPQHLDRLAEALLADPTLDAVHCGWTRVTPDGRLGSPHFAPAEADLFTTFAGRSALQLNACIVKKSVVMAAGGFDPTLRTCQDWDFWQRIARLGTRFGAVPEVLARYCTRPGSVSQNGQQLLQDGLRVIEHGHAEDARVSQPHPQHRYGRSPTLKAQATLYHLCWCTAVHLGSSGQAGLLLNEVPTKQRAELVPEYLAAMLFEGVLLPQGLSPEAWLNLWPRLESNIHHFLQQLERLSQQPLLAQQTLPCLIQNVFAHMPASPAKTVGSVHVTQIDAASAMMDLALDKSITWLHAEVSWGEQVLGNIDVPVAAGAVPQGTLQDAIACGYAWPILGHYFNQTVYPQLRQEQGPDGASVWRGELCLIENLATDDGLFWSKLHDEIGWVIFLQELWNRPAWPVETFYALDVVEEPLIQQQVAAGRLIVEAAEDVPELLVTGPDLDVLLTVAGAPLGRLLLPAGAGAISAQKLRACLTRASRFELCRLAVREGLIGRPGAETASLRQNLRQAARARQAVPVEWENTARLELDQQDGDTTAETAIEADTGAINA